ncbi:MAG: PAC2 family protein [Thaumarchaeota archaeon]|nr:PAC2 family protein [Nitrososphaerota archaeon]
MLGLRIHTLPKLNKPIMIAALPDMGNVAGIGMDFLVKKLKAKLFAEIYAFWPPAVSYYNGLIKYEQSSYNFHYSQKDNLVFFSGEFNPSDPRRLYELCYEVVNMAKKLKVDTLYTIGAALRQTSHTEPKLFAATTASEHLGLLKKENLELLNGKGQITGFNGLILGIAKEKQLDGICILSEIDNPNVIQPRSAQLIIAKLLQILRLRSLDMKELEEEEKRKQFMEQQMSYMNGLARKDNQPGIA